MDGAAMRESTANPLADAGDAEPIDDQAYLQSGSDDEQRVRLPAPAGADDEQRFLQVRLPARRARLVHEEGRGLLCGAGAVPCPPGCCACRRRPPWVCRCRHPRRTTTRTPFSWRYAPRSAAVAHCRPKDRPKSARHGLKEVRR